MLSYTKSIILIIASCFLGMAPCPTAEEEAQEIVNKICTWCESSILEDKKLQSANELRLIFNENIPKAFQLIKPDGSTINLIPPCIIEARSLAQHAIAEMTPLELGPIAANIVDFYLQTRRDLALPGHSGNIFDGTLDIEGYSCGELEKYSQARKAEIYGDSNPPLSEVCPVFKAIIYNEILLYYVFKGLILLHYLKDSYEAQKEFVKVNFEQLIEFKKNYIRIYADGNPGRSIPLNDLEDALRVSVQRMLRDQLAR
ncbi:hypothetical protein FJ366_02775 [Candidatus Dependentiae bacterium]|nr:hypothetical protein [Candidatus Dependentiae bacterium]